ncbi:hypothetical protein OGAPHI_005748 [Ogataea philodendri]|uniref:Mmc1 C-terminal domain-containing protein n=1 Tax=Ogataea philodendri TaxID=1378263 RepID=A0A9P8T299_9ASCO|nr:uncharacterized protein OGAPHI_005748 [Ogataea philodendri]KAH3662496.1 hypothetical protein OGAPHI_005748 [Ogataea philodendri]
MYLKGSPSGAFVRQLANCRWKSAFTLPQRRTYTESSGKTPSLDDLLERTKAIFPTNRIITKKARQLVELGAGSRPDLLPIKIGVVQSPSITPGLFLDVLLCDPLDPDQSWFEQLRQRRTTKKDNFWVRYGENGVKSPILSRDLRVIQNETVGDNSSKNELHRELFRNIEFLEINQPDLLHQSGSQVSETTSTVQNSVPTDCHLYIYVKSRPGEPLEVGDYPSLTVLNTSIQEHGASFQSQTHDDLVVDLEKANLANKLLLESPNNVSKYLELVKNSRITSLLFTLSRETSGDKPFVLLLQSLLSDIDQQLKFEQKPDIVREVDSLKKEIDSWAQLSHFELQSKIAPYLNDVLIQRFSKVAQIVPNIDDFDLVLSKYLFDDETYIQKSMFNFTPVKCHGSLLESTAKLNYLEGKVDLLLPPSTQEPEPLASPLSILKHKVINSDLPALQNQVSRTVLHNLAAINLPVFAVCSVGHVIDYISVDTAVAIVVFSFAISSNNISKAVYRYLAEFKNRYLDNTRTSIDRSFEHLRQRLERNLEENGLNKEEKQRLRQQLTNELSKLT